MRSNARAERDVTCEGTIEAWTLLYVRHSQGPASEPFRRLVQNNNTATPPYNSAPQGIYLVVGVMYLVC